MISVFPYLTLKLINVKNTPSYSHRQARTTPGGEYGQRSRYLSQGELQACKPTHKNAPLLAQ